VNAEHERIFGFLERKEGKIRPAEIRRKHTEMMDKYVGIARNDEGLKTMLKEIEKTKELLDQVYIEDKSANYNFEWIDALEIPIRLDMEEATTKAALMRTESRAAHYRNDYPKMDNKNWLKNIIVKMSGNKMVLETRPVITTLLKAEEMPEFYHAEDPFEWKVR